GGKARPTPKPVIDVESTETGAEGAAGAGAEGAGGAGDAAPAPKSNGVGSGPGRPAGARGKNKKQRR
ncbi:MAG TPA: hypothetical protein VNO30_06425, partial [Kofleriaceae bacterium]|nr:hypothetical protein [Kofleriaceae bacterium]